MQFILLLFILVPIIEIGVFIQVGDLLGLGLTLMIVFATAIIGVNLLKQQGIRAWTDIQTRMAQGQVPALEMASAAQLLFAGGLLLTPGFVTDAVGFALMVPAIRLVVAKQLMSRWSAKTNQTHSSQFSQQAGFSPEPHQQARSRQKKQDQVIEGEFEDHTE